MDKHIIELYNQALKDYDEAIQKLERIKREIQERLDWNAHNRRYAETESEDDIFLFNISTLHKILQIIDEEE